MALIKGKDGVFDIELDGVRGMTIKKVNTRGAVMIQDIHLRLLDDELYRLYLELQKVYGGLLL